MKSIFELFGFLSMACISAAIIFIFLGKKDVFSGTGDKLVSAYNIAADAPSVPKSVTKGIRDSYASESGSARRAKGSRESSLAAMSNAAPEERLKTLYSDAEFVSETIKKWKATVANVADEYNVKPQLLLANVVIQSYLGSYSASQLNEDAAQHAGDRVMPAASAAKRYKFGWSVQKIADQHNMSRYFATEIPTATATATRMVSSKNSSAADAVAARPSAPKVTPTAQTSPVEAGIKNMVAKEYGFGSWNGLSRLADPDRKAEAQHRVNALLMAARIK